MPSWKELKRFLEKDGWELYKDTDHSYYRKDVGAGHDTPRFTKVSRGSGEIPKKLWQIIRRKQLQITQEYFNDHI